MKPTMRYQKAKDAGKQAYNRNHNLMFEAETNPYRYLADVALASWWDAGYQEAERDTKAPIHRIPE